MVRRGPLLLLTFLLGGCPDDVGRGLRTGATGLVAPTNLAGVPNGGSEILLTWIDRATVETGYRVEMSFSPFDTPVNGDVQFLPADAASFSFPAFPNATFYFRVFAITGTMESDPSNIVTVVTPDVPLPPTGLTASAWSFDQIDLSWLDVSNETGYSVQRSVDGGASWNTVTTLPANLTTQRMIGLAPDTEYGWRVIATNQNGASTPSDATFAWTATAAMTMATVPISGDFGKFTSFVVKPDGWEHISCYDVANSNVLYVFRSVGTPFFPTAMDAGLGGPQDVGADGTSVAAENSGSPHIVAHDVTSDTLRYLHIVNGVWTSETIDVGGARPKLVCDGATDTLHAVYQSRAVNGNVVLRYAKKPWGQSWVTTDLDTTAVLPGTGHSLVLDGLGHPRVLLVGAAGGLYEAVRPPFNPAILIVRQIPFPSQHGTPDFTALAIDGQGTVHAICHGSLSKSLHHLSRGQVSPDWTLETIHSEPGRDVGANCAVAADPLSGRLHVAYYDATNRDLRYARKDPNGLWVKRIIDAAGDVGSHVSLCVDGAGAVHLCYRDETNRQLKVAVGAP